MDTKEEKIFLSNVEEKYNRSINDYMTTNTDFLDLNQQSMVKKKYSSVFLYGGFPDAERKIALFLPDYLDISSYEELAKYYKENPSENPLTLISAKYSDYRPLSHKDFLGSLMGLGIKRELVGDILVGKDQCSIIVMKKIAPFILDNLEKAGRVYLQCVEKDVSEIVLQEENIEEKWDSIASLRLDNVIACLFNQSRNDSQTKITQGLVFVNGINILKTDYQVKEGDTLVLRGSGKAILLEITGETRKGRIGIKIKKYK